MDEWHTTTIDEACNVEYGTRVVQKRDGGSIYPVYGGGGATFFMDITNRASRVVVSRFGMSEECTRYVDGEFFLNDSGITLSPKETGTLLPTFLDRLTLALNDEVFALGKGAAQKNLDVAAFRQLRISYPISLSEQCRIVAILDEAFEGIATAKANAERSLQNARELAETLGEACFDEHLNDSFVSRELASLCDLIVDCEHKTAPTQERGYPSIRTPNIGKGRLMLDVVNRVSEETYAIWTRRAIPLPGDLILAREAPAGNVAVIPKGMHVCLGQRTVLIRPKRDVFEPEYLAHLLLQRISQRRLLAHSRGATVQHVNMKDIRAFMIASVPSLDTQLQVVEKLARIHQACESMEVAQRKKLVALEDLKKSLLHVVFTGALTPKSADKQVAEVA